MYLLESFEFVLAKASFWWHYHFKLNNEVPTVHRVLEEGHTHSSNDLVFLIGNHLVFEQRDLMSCAVQVLHSKLETGEGIQQRYFLANEKISTHSGKHWMFRNGHNKQHISS